MAAPFARTTRSLAADSPRLAFVAWLIAFVVLLAWGGWFFGSRVTVVEVSRKARLEVSSAPHALSAQLAGRLATSSLSIGRAVKAGEVLAELDASGPQLRLREEQARLQALPPRVASLEQEMASVQAVIAADQRAALAALQAGQARVQQAGAEAGFAEDNARRLRAEVGSGSVAEVDALRAAAEAGKQGAAREALAADLRRTELDARTRVQQAQVQLETLKRAALTLQGEIAGATASVARLEQEVERHRVRAPVDGVVGEVLALTTGAWITEGQKMATIVPRGDLRVIAEFDPASALGRLRPGQTAQLKLDGFPWAQYGSVQTQVLRVAAEVRDGALRVELQPAADTRSSALLQHGLTGTVEVGIESAAPATLVLRAAGQAVHP